MKSGTQSTARAVETYVEERPAGEPFATSELLGLGTRAAIDQALSRLAKAGTIERLASGIYVRSRVSKYVGKVVPTPEEVAHAAARSTGSVVEVHGAEAAREFGLSTQVPVQPMFVTSGRSREIPYGEVTIVLRHAAPRHMILAGRPAGRAFAALLYLGRNEVTHEVIEAVRHRLSAAEFELLASARAQMPSWMSDVFCSYEAAQEPGLEVA
jgi:hypothetical protein